MILYFAGNEPGAIDKVIMENTSALKIDRLYSFLAWWKWDDSRWEEIHNKFVEFRAKNKFSRIIMDSGAHTISGAFEKRAENMQAMKEMALPLARRYLDFIKRFKDVVDAFFEVDTAPYTFSYEKQVEMRKAFFDAAGDPMKFIPVFHNRYDSNVRKVLEDHVYNYPYVGITGIHQEFNQSMFESYFDEIKKSGCKIHGLAVTAYEKMSEFPFYSVDSSSYLRQGITRTFLYFNQKTAETKTYSISHSGNNCIWSKCEAEQNHVLEYIKYLKKKYGLDIPDDMRYLCDIKHTTGVDGYAICIYNICSYLECLERIHKNGHTFDGKKQGELFDLMEGK